MKQNFHKNIQPEYIKLKLHAIIKKQQKLNTLLR